MANREINIRIPLPNLSALCCWTAEKTGECLYVFSAMELNRLKGNYSKKKIDLKRETGDDREVGQQAGLSKSKIHLKLFFKTKQRGYGGIIFKQVLWKWMCWCV